METISEIEEIQKEAEEKIRLITWRNEIIEYVDANALKEETKIVHPNPRFWHLCFPNKYEEGKMVYSPEQFQEFERAIEFGNEQVDKFVQMYVEGAKEYARNHANKINCRNHFWEATEIGWVTFALPNFMNSPKLGKRAHFNNMLGPENYEFLKHSTVGFIPWDINGKINTLFIGTKCYEGTLKTIAEEMKRLNPDGLESSISGYMEMYPHEMPEHLRYF